MVVAYPWTGRDWNARIAISGRAAMPGLPGGSGFNWRSTAATTGFLRPHGLGRIARRRAGFRLGFRGLGQACDPTIATCIDNTTGLDSTSTINVGTILASSSAPFGTAGTDVSTDSTGMTTCTAASASSCPPGSVWIYSPSPFDTSAGSAAAQGASSTPWYASLLSSLAKTGSQIANYELNPLTNKSTYIQTAQGVIATNQPTTVSAAVTPQGLVATTGLPLTTTISNYMPLILLGGGVLVLLMMMKR